MMIPSVSRPRSDLTAPPSEPVEWLCVCAHLHSRCKVTERTWFAARETATRMLGCDRGSVVCEQVKA
jgi:hypothetical protein